MAESNNFKNISVHKDIKNRFVANKMVKSFAKKKISVGKIASVALEMFMDPTNQQVAEQWLTETVAAEHNIKVDKKLSKLEAEKRELQKQKIAA
jgi:hypothetical protein